MVGRVLALAVALALAAACAGPPPGTNGGQGGRLRVVAGENFWASIASQLGGSRVTVQALVSDPNADPHEYESTPADARAVAEADLVVLNGAGYDDWGRKLLAAGSSGHRRVLDVAALLGNRAGDNPHFWYDPEAVSRVADRITAEYRALDPGGGAYFDGLRVSFSAALGGYEGKIAEIRQRYAGAKIGATEDLFVYMAAALGLDLVSPPPFMAAVAQGTEPPASAVIAFQNQLARRQIRVLVDNVQTETAVTGNVRRQAAAQGIPIVGVSETLRPRGASFQAWQLDQLTALEAALARNPE